MRTKKNPEMPMVPKAQLKTVEHQLDQYKAERDTLKSKYNNLTNHIRMKAENNPGVSRYIDLVNYIDRLERD